MLPKYNCNFGYVNDLLLVWNFTKNTMNMNNIGHSSLHNVPMYMQYVFVCTYSSFHKTAFPDWYIR